MTPPTDDGTLERAHMRLVTDLIDASDYAGNLAEAVTDILTAGVADYGPGELVHLARNTRIKSMHVLTAAVHYELAAGHSWEQVAEGLGLGADHAEEIYGPGYDAWQGDGQLRLPQMPPSATRAADRWPTDPDGFWARVCRWRRKRSAARVSSP